MLTTDLGSDYVRRLMCLCNDRAILKKMDLLAGQIAFLYYNI